MVLQPKAKSFCFWNATRIYWDMGWTFPYEKGCLVLTDPAWPTHANFNVDLLSISRLGCFPIFWSVVIIQLMVNWWFGARWLDSQESPRERGCCKAGAPLENYRLKLPVVRSFGNQPWQSWGDFHRNIVVFHAMKTSTFPLGRQGPVEAILTTLTEASL